jgi:hypothetical protein
MELIINFTPCGVKDGQVEPDTNDIDRAWLDPVVEYIRLQATQPAYPRRFGTLSRLQLFYLITLAGIWFLNHIQIIIFCSYIFDGVLAKLILTVVDVTDI